MQDHGNSRQEQSYESQIPIVNLCLCFSCVSHGVAVAARAKACVAGLAAKKTLSGTFDSSSLCRGQTGRKEAVSVLDLQTCRP